MSRKIKWIVIIAVIIILVGFVAVRFSPGNPSSHTPIKIGVATLLSGDYSALGENIVNTARLTIGEINKRGGVGGRPIELFAEDSKLSSKDGLLAVQKLIDADGVKYIIAGMSSNGTLAAAPIANKNKVLLLSPVTGGPNIDNAGEYIFRIANSDSLAGRDIADAMIGRGYTRIGALSEVAEYTLDLEKSFRETLVSKNVAPIFEENFQPGNKDFRSQITKIKAANVDALLVVSQTGLSGGYFIKQARELGLRSKIFSDFNLATNMDAQKIAGSFSGIYFADPAYDVDKPELKSFFAQYRQQFGHDPAIPFHTAATYDSIQMLVAALKASGDDSAKVHDWLLGNVKNWDGFMGRYSLDARGNSDLGFKIKLIQ